VVNEASSKYVSERNIVSLRFFITRNYSLMTLFVECYGCFIWHTGRIFERNQGALLVLGVNDSSEKVNFMISASLALSLLSEPREREAIWIFRSSRRDRLILSLAILSWTSCSDGKFFFWRAFFCQRKHSQHRHSSTYFLFIKAGVGEKR